MHKKGFMVLGLALCVLLGGCSGGNTQKELEETRKEAQTEKKTDKKTDKKTEKDSEMVSETNTETDTVKRAETEEGTDSGKQAETETEINSEKPGTEMEINSKKHTETETEINSKKHTETETEINSEKHTGKEKEIDSEARTDTEREMDAAGQEEAGTVSEDGAGEVDLSDGLFGVFETVTLDGEKVDQNIFAQADLNMVNIWGTFCGPCIKEMPELGELAEEYAEKGVRLIGIISDAWEPGNEAAEKIIEKTGADYTHLVLSESLVLNYLAQVQAVPTTIFLDREGKQVGEVCVGAKSKEDWSKLIDEMLEEAAK